jgi:hypothetical protein
MQGMTDIEQDLMIANKRISELQDENERLNDFEHSQCAKMLAKGGKLWVEFERLREVDRWIPVSERQPKSKDAVNGMIEVWDEYGPDTMSIDYYWEYVTKVTHWRPLPAAPEKEANADVL